MTLEYFSDLTSAKKIKIKRSKYKDKNKNTRYHLVPESIEITPAKGKAKTITFQKNK
jgi:hypothetical protein